jgi:hypothetical protein
MKKIGFLILFCVFSITSMAQQYQSNPRPPRPKAIKRIGLQAGLNLPQMVFTEITDASIYPDMKPFPRFNAGFYSESGVSENFVTQIGLFYSGAGYRTGETTTTIDYISIPLIFNFRAEIAGPVSFLVGAGPYGSFAFNGVMKDDEFNFIDRNILSMRKKEARDNKPFLIFDAGLIFSGAIEYKLNNDNLLKLGASYNFGVMNISNEHVLDFGDGNFMEIGDLGARNRILSIHLTYMLDLMNKE